ncbi:Terpene synthase, N-terminal domain containing protein [Trema orientale]|uniref:Terpene synthase, N-terminal domain containing protein n=1 Tax=Trema orientale TaxID=63057 RepID=A0A2P5F9K8_TREOI|nr:Terpene synthase, N-terminal domain containing protein [Trema orientale]
MFEKAAESPLVQLEQIDALQRLGISYHFEDEIKRVLIKTTHSYNSCNDAWKRNDLYATALEFKLLRQHGYRVPSEVFNVFKDENGGFKACLREDVKGILSLYEASFHLFKGETILEEARDFTTKHLEEYMRVNKDQSADDLVILVDHALELPLHWRMLRLEARWFIDVYGRKHDTNPTVLELAKLDFNVVQSVYLEDLKHASRLELEKNHLMIHIKWWPLILITTDR